MSNPKPMLEVSWWQRIFALDLRSLAAARIMAGLVLLVDLIVRLTNARAFLSEEGVYPRQAILDSYSALPLPSFHLANDTLAYQIALLVLHMLLSLALLAGYRTRQTTVLCWVMLVSLHMRNSLILNNGDVLLSASLFWGMFLPWGSRWSWDARGALEDERATLYLSAASVGMVIQVASVYLFAAFHKMLHPYWMTEGSAVLYALSIDPHATEWAKLLTPFSASLKRLTHFIVFAELAAGLALLAPWMRLRALTLLACMAMHWSFGAFLELGIFRWSPWVGLLALIPSWVYRRPQPKGVEDRLDPTVQTVVLLGLCALTWAVNLQSLGRGQITLLPQTLARMVPSLGAAQYWGVFTGDGLKDDSWFTIEVRTRNGKSYDQWLGEKPFSKGKPDLLISRTFPDDRWRKWMMNLPLIFAVPGRAESFARWWQSEWDRKHPDDPAVSVTVWQIHEPTSPDGTSTGLYWQKLAEVGP